jgi:hypothetical protein
MDLHQRLHTDYYMYSLLYSYRKMPVERWWEPSCRTCCFVSVLSSSEAVEPWAGHMEKHFGLADCRLRFRPPKARHMES